MKRFYFGILALSLFFLIGCSEDGLVDTSLNSSDIQSSSPFLKSNANNSKIPGQYIVTLKEGVLNVGKSIKGKKAFDAHENGLKNQIAKNFKGIGAASIQNAYGFAMNGFTAKLSNAQVAKLRNDARVLKVESDETIVLGPPPGKGKPGSGGDGGDGGTSAQETPWGITRVGGAQSVSGKTAWIIDSGIDLDHPDLNVNVAMSKTFFTSGRDSKSADDGNGHGTHCAGTVGAKDNNIGVIGVAPGVPLVALKVLDSRGSGSFSYTISALDYVAANANPGDAVNMSLGPRSRYTDNAVDNAVINVASMGILIAKAAGNESDDCSYYSPARVDHPNAYTVSAMDINDRFASFSNYGSPVDYAAPGVSVKSTWKGGGYNTISGTSMASPHVCGLLLLGLTTDGTFVKNDPDGNPDPIAYHN